MSKRSFQKFKRRKGDRYLTVDPKPVQVLLKHLPPRIRFAEPCAGKGHLSDQLVRAGHTAEYLGDTNPGRGDIVCQDALSWNISERPKRRISYIITNPVWTRPVMHEMIVRFSSMRPTWLLFDADWAHTDQAAPYRHLCQKIVSVGRVSWMGNGVGGYDNCAWYLFDARHQGATIFTWRTAA